MKLFSEWLKDKVIEDNINEGWWPFSRKEEPEAQPEPEMKPKANPIKKELHWSKDPRYQAKGLDMFRTVGFVHCPNCGDYLHHYDLESKTTGRCRKCHEPFWVNEELSREMRRHKEYSIARSRGFKDYEFEGGRYKVDPKAAADAERRAKYAIRDDLSNI